MMTGSRFTRFFKGSNPSKKKQSQIVNTQQDEAETNVYFKLLANTEEKKYIQEICKGILVRNKYFHNHADIFCKFSGMTVEAFKDHMGGIKGEVEEAMKSGKLKELNKIKMLNDWFVAQEELLDQRLLDPIDQQCQEMYALLLQHADKSRSFDTRSPQEFRAFLEKVRSNHHGAKSQLQAYSSGEVDISVKDNALTTLRKAHSLLKSLKGSLNRRLSEVKEPANTIQKEIDQSYNKLLQHAEQSRSFTDQDPEEFKRNLGKIKDRRKAAISQLQKYLSGVDNSDEKKQQAFKVLDKCLNDLKEIEKKLLLLSDLRSHSHKMAVKIQQSYERLLEYADQSLSFANQEQQEFEENLKRIKNDQRRANSYIEKLLARKTRDEANRLRAIQELEKCLDEIKELERGLDTFLLKDLNDKISHTYSKLLEHVEQSQSFTEQQRQYFIEDLKDMNKRYEQARSVIEHYIIENEQDMDKKYEEFSILEGIKRDLDLTLANQTNAKIMQICNHLNKYAEYIPAEENEQWKFKERLESIEGQRKDAHAKFERYVSGSDISEEEKCGAFETLEKCLEKTKAIEIDMAPLLKDPMIQKIDQSYEQFLQGANKSTIFTRQELQDLDQTIVDIKKYVSTDNKREKSANKSKEETTVSAYEVLKEKLDKLSTLERKISFYLQLQGLHHDHVKVASTIDNRLSNTASLGSDKIRSITKALEPNIVKAKNSFEEATKNLKDDAISMVGYLGELSLNEYYKSIESLRKQASQLLGIDISLRPSKSGKATLSDGRTQKLDQID